VPQCAFKKSMLNVSAIRIKYRILLRSSSTHKLSDPPFRVVLFFICTTHLKWSPLAVAQLLLFKPTLEGYSSIGVATQAPENQGTLAKHKAKPTTL
jgi:hypothetical protein